MNFPDIPSVPDKQPQLEQEKLQLEIKELRRPYLLRTQWIGLYATLVISVTTLVIFQCNGVFDKKKITLTAEKSILELDKKILEVEIVEFTSKKKIIEDSITVYQAENESLKTENNLLADKNQTLDSTQKRLETNITDAKRTIDKYKQRIDSVSLFYKGILDFTAGQSYKSYLTYKDFYEMKIQKTRDSLLECLQNKYQNFSFLLLFSLRYLRRYFIDYYSISVQSTVPSGFLFGNCSCILITGGKFLI